MPASRFVSAARWLAPSAAAACGGTLVAGVVEGLATNELLGGIAAAGFLALFALPLLLVASIAARAIWAAWKPHELGIVEDGGGAPLLAGWLAVVVLGGLLLAWAMFQGTWLLERTTAFKPLSVSYMEPVFATAAALVAAILSRPVAHLVAAGVRRADARWRARGRRSLVTPWRIAATTAVLAIAIPYVLWRIVVKPRIGELDLSPLFAPVLGIAATAAVHLLGNRLARGRAIAGGALGVLVAAAIGVAVFAWQERPSLTLEIWGERPLSGLVVDELFDLDAIHDRIPTGELRPAEKPGAPHPDIVLVTIDTVRADHTPPYGGNAEMPVLRELGVKGAVFDWAFSPSNVTRRSIPSMMIGLAPNRVHGRVVGWGLRVDPRHVMLAERFAAAGYETAGFMCCEGLYGKEMHTGLQRGLEHLEIEPHENGLALSKLARAWIEARDKRGDTKPLFLWMHVLEPHNWQAGSGAPRNDEERRRFYDRSLAVADLSLVQLLDAFANRPPARAPIVIITADHGEALGDHGQPYHSTDLYDSQIRVPLVIAGPGIKPGHVEETVSLVDLAPTLLELAGLVPPADSSVDGHSFAALATGGTPGDRESGIAYAAMIKDRSNPGGITAVIRGRYKLIDFGSSSELYDVHSDPDERSNLIAVKPGIAESLRQLLRAYEVKAKQSPFD
ncbi:MAG: sulfatase-like hydrolase/transferase [Acidobacteriota bacterium]